MKTIPVIIGIGLMKLMSPCTSVNSTDPECIKTVWTTEETPRHVGWLIPYNGTCQDTMKFKPVGDWCEEIKPKCI